MPFALHYHEESRILETLYEDPLTLEDTKAAARANLEEAAAKGTRWLLADCTRLQNPGSTVSNYELGNYILSLNPDPRLKEAVLLPRAEGIASNLNFYADVAHNRGIQVRTFDSRADAIAWLIR